MDDQSSSTSIPLKPIPFPQKYEPSLEEVGLTTSTGETSRSTSAHSKTSQDKFDLMDIQLTVYSLSGLRCCTKQTQDGKRSRKEKRKERKERRAKGFTAASTSSTPIPTTAVISFRRNVVSSGTTIETYFPSQGLKLPAPKPDIVSVQTASWLPDSSSLDGLETSSVSFHVTKIMQQQSYRRDLSIRDVGNYSPETVEVKVGVGRGKEILPLGVAAIAVTGDEEGESILNVPVKNFRNELIDGIGFDKKRRPKRGDRRRQATKFSSDPLWRYGLEENATLRVGVKVTPTAIKKQYDERKSQEKTLDEILDGLYDENLVIQLSDENSLLNQFIGEKDSAKRKEKEGKDEEKEGGSFWGISNLLCGMVSLCGEVENVEDDCPCKDNVERNVESHNEEVREEIKVGSKKSEAIVLSLSLMSSVSESTYGSEIETPVSDIK